MKAAPPVNVNMNVNAYKTMNAYKTLTTIGATDTVTSRKRKRETNASLMVLRLFLDTAFRSVR